MDETAQEYIRQLDEQSIIPNVDDRGAKNLRIARVELALEKFELLHLHRIDLGFGRDPFGDRDVLRGCGDPAHIYSGAPVLFELGQGPMHEQIRVAPDRAGEM